MNWLDMIMIFILIYVMIKGLRLGLVSSIFNIIQVILSVIITKKYYPIVNGYIINNSKVYNIFKGIVEFILKVLFYSKAKEQTNLISDLISKGLLRIIISLFSIILVFWLANILMNLILGFFSSLLKAPVLKQLNKVGGIIFGLIEGLFIVYLLNLVLSPIALTFPETFIGKGVLNSLIFDYLKDIGLMLNLYSIKSFI